MTTSVKTKIAIASQALAVVTHAYLTNSYYRLKFGMAEGKSLCNISDLLNCDAVSVSPFASIFDVPLALGGVLFNAFLLLALLWFTQFPRPQLQKQIRIFAGLLALTSVAMAVISTTQLSTYCLFCILTYILSFITLASVWNLEAKGDPGAGLFEGSALKWFIAGAIGLPSASFLGHAVIQANLAKGFDQQVKSMVDGWLIRTDSNLAQVDGLVLGAPPQSARMLIVEFADYQCIHCKMAAPSVKNFVKSRKDVSLIYVPFPLDGQCNAAIKQAGNGRSCVLSASAICANKQGKGWEVSDWMFENFGKFELAELTSFVEGLGIDMEQFRSCREAPETLDSIRKSAKIGEDAGVKGTPTFFVNGRQLQGAQFLPVLDAAHKKILGR